MPSMHLVLQAAAVACIVWGVIAWLAIQRNGDPLRQSEVEAAHLWPATVTALAATGLILLEAETVRLAVL